MNGDKNTHQGNSSSNSSNSSIKQCYLERRSGTDFLAEMDNEALMKKKGRNKWHYLAMGGNVVEEKEEEVYDIITRKFKARKTISTEKQYNLTTQGINAQDRYGNSPLHYAYAYTYAYVHGNSHDDTIKALLAKGANPDIQNTRGQKPTAYQYTTPLNNIVNSTKQLETTAIPTQEQFVAEVKKFKQTHNIKSLKEEVFSPIGKTLYKQFINNPIILAWLTRPFAVVQFREDGAPAVDKYELEFYDGFALYSAQLYGHHASIDARAVLGSESITHFYEGYASRSSLGLNNKKDIFAKEEQGVSIRFPGDIYRAGDDALGKHLASNRSTPLPIINIANANHYVIYCTGKDGVNSGHQITCATKYDDKGAVAAVFLLNSWRNQFYSTNIAEAFKRSAYYSTPAPYAWIDVSHDIQTAENDRNCVIYAFNFAKATKEFLAIPAYRAQMDTYCNAKQYQEAGTYLSDGIKALMPQYYQKDEKGVMVTVSPEALKTYHLQFRWEMGNEAIRRLHDLAMM